MTNQEAINIIKSECYVANLLNLDRTRMVNTALDKACEALKQIESIKVAMSMDIQENATKMLLIEDVIERIEEVSE